MRLNKAEIMLVKLHFNGSKSNANQTPTCIIDGCTHKEISPNLRCLSMFESRTPFVAASRHFSSWPTSGVIDRNLDACASESINLNSPLFFGAIFKVSNIIVLIIGHFLSNGCSFMRVNF